VRSGRPDVPVEVDALVARCLERDPEARFQNAAELAAALDAAAGGGAPLAPLRPVAASVPRRAASVESSPGVPHAPTTVEPRPAATDPGGPRPEIQRASPRRRRRWAGVVPVALLVLVLLGVVGYLVVTGDSGNGNGKGAAAGNTDTPPRIVSAQDFDPFGDDHVEHHELVGNVFDKNPNTFWMTSQYDNATMDKPGVGIYVQLASPTKVTTVDVDTKESGWNGAIYAADSPGATLSAWGQPLAQQTNLGTHTRFTLSPAKTARVVLLWITRLPDQTPHQLQVGEITVG
jgi:hypothetical protein